MNIACLSPLELHSALRTKGGITLLDVRLPDDYEECHLPGARNNTVFEMLFINRMKELVPDPQTRICVYGEHALSMESKEAAKKLAKLGYNRIFDLHGGLQSWSSCGLPIEGNLKPQQPSSDTDGTYHLDLELSHLIWTGRNLLNSHRGDIKFSSGSLIIEHLHLREAHLELDFNTIRCFDLLDSPQHDILIQHLRSDDFFDVESYPTARIHLYKSIPLAPLNSGSPNLEVLGELCLRGITRPIRFTACVGLDEQNRPVAQAHFSIDRTRWNILYGSGKFFHRLAHHLVNDEILIELRIVCKKS